MKLSNALQRIITVIKEYIDRVIPKKLSDLEIDIEMGSGSVNTVNGIEPDENGNIDLDFPLTDDDALALVIEMGFVTPVGNNGRIFTDKNGAIFIL